MDLRYIMLKNRYKFTMSPQISLYSEEDNIKRGQEVSLYTKELSLYGVELKNIVKQRPRPNIKDELLNIAYGCIENKKIYDNIRSKRKLPIKLVSEFTYKSKNYIDKWQYYIIAYILLICNTSYANLKNYLNIKFYETSESNNQASDNNKLSILDKHESTNLNTYTGIVLKVANKSVFILTSSGYFIKIKPTEKDICELGHLCTGILKKDLTFIKYPINLSYLAACILFILSYFIYFHSSRTVLVDANSLIKLDINFFNRIVKITPLSPYGNKIASSTKLFNTSMDDGLYLILKEAEYIGALNNDTKISIFISGSNRRLPELSNLETFILEKNLKIQINNNGTEHKIDTRSKKQ